MTFSRIVLRPIAAALLIMAAGVYVEVPGPYRALTPRAFGLSEVAPGIFIDRPVRAPEFLPLIRRSEDLSAAFFGRSEVRPRYVLCTSGTCQNTFGFRAVGLTIGYHLVLIAPAGLNEQTLTHERVHVDLHALMGPLDLINPRFPTWFDEGLASFLAGDTFAWRPRTTRDADWVTAAWRLDDWLKLRKTRPVAELYSAARTLVAEIAARAGRDGLRQLVARVAGGADFDTEYRALIRR